MTLDGCQRALDDQLDIFPALLTTFGWNSHGADASLCLDFLTIYAWNDLRMAKLKSPLAFNDKTTPQGRLTISRCYCIPWVWRSGLRFLDSRFDSIPKCQGWSQYSPGNKRHQGRDAHSRCTNTFIPPIAKRASFFGLAFTTLFIALTHCLEGRRCPEGLASYDSPRSPTWCGPLSACTIRTASRRSVHGHSCEGQLVCFFDVGSVSRLAAYPECLYPPNGVPRTLRL